jgi:hypothetical protein
MVAVLVRAIFFEPDVMDVHALAGALRNRQAIIVTPRHAVRIRARRSGSLAGQDAAVLGRPMPCISVPSPTIHEDAIEQGTARSALH